MRISGRGFLAGIFWLLASLGIMLSSVTVWAHQSLLNTNGWSRLVSDVFDDPEVVAGTSEIVVDRVSGAIDLRAQVDRILPGEMNLLSGAITGRVEDAIGEALARLLEREDVQSALVTVNAATHQATLRAIRGGGEALSSDDGTITLNVFPVIEGALLALQEAGFIDAAREIPDLSEQGPSAETVSRLETLLGRELPDDIGSIELVASDRLANVQEAVRVFDLVTIGVLLATVALAAVALWLSRRRLRMVLWLALGAVAALALGRAVTRLLVQDMSGALADGPEGDTVQAVIETTVDQVTTFSLVVIALALVVAAIALWLEHRSERRARQAAGLETQVRGGSRVAAQEVAASRSMQGWVAENRRTLTLAGLGVIGLLVIWQVAGPDIALPAIAAAGIWLVAINVLAGRPRAESTDDADVAYENA